MKNKRNTADRELRHQLEIAMENWPILLHTLDAWVVDYEVAGDGATAVELWAASAAAHREYARAYRRYVSGDTPPADILANAQAGCAKIDAFLDDGADEDLSETPSSSATPATA